MTKTRVAGIAALGALIAMAACDRARIDSQRFVNRGVQALEAGEPDVAYDFFSQATAIDPGNAEAHYHLGLVLAHERKQPEAARVCFEEARKLTPDDPDLLYQLGVLARDAGKPKEARELLERSRTRHGNPAEVTFQIALLDDAIGNLPDLDRDLRETLRFDPLHEQAYYELANLYLRINEPDRAMRVLEDAMQIEPRFAPLHFLYAGLLKRSGRLKEAMRSLETGVNLDPNHAEGYFDLGYALAALGRYRDAIFHLEQYVSRAKEKSPERARMARTLIDKLWVEVDRKVDQRDPNLRLF